MLKMLCKAYFYPGLFAATALLAVPPAVSCLPVNEDMVNVQPRTGQFAREIPEGTAPLGAESRDFGTDRTAALSLRNAVRADAESIDAGKRFFDVQCSTCHGKYDEAGERTVSPVAQFLPAPPDLGVPEVAAKPDGHFFQYIHFGGVVAMPVYGYKASITEHWDVVNYLRSFQSARKK